MVETPGVFGIVMLVYFLQTMAPTHITFWKGEIAAQQVGKDSWFKASVILCTESSSYNLRLGGLNSFEIDSFDGNSSTYAWRKA